MRNHLVKTTLSRPSRDSNLDIPIVIIIIIIIIMSVKHEVHPTEIRTSISPSLVVWLNTTGALANYATEAGSTAVVMFCYYGSWATYRQGEGTFNVADIDATLCSHLVYAFAGVSSEGLIESLDPYNDLSDNWGKGSFNKFSALAKTNPDVKTLLAIGGWNHGSVTFSNDNFVLLLSTLKEYLHAEDLLLTVAVAASTQVLEESYNISGIAENTDYISVMTFDYHTASEDSVTGINSPLDPLATDTGENLKKNIKASIAAWVDGGAPKSKLLVGFPLYGRTFTLASSADTEIGAQTSGPGEPGVYTQEAGYLGFYEICTKLITEGDSWTSVYDADSATLYAYNDDQWVTFDDVKTFTTKANYVVEEGLGGAMVWPVETDDFHGICSGIKNPLQKLIKSILKSLSREATVHVRCVWKDALNYHPLLLSGPAKEMEVMTVLVGISTMMITGSTAFITHGPATIDPRELRLLFYKVVFCSRI
ncbi:unnamed protein product [Timema podura]|uniref:GH18 domain-containing protein n=1 Tax=Timema podura TaxID=61482 RepID=A0ABN7NL43_TIMPD|nr:unnamed protein product [Timema podura]